jgi:hypothetical protein
MSPLSVRGHVRALQDPFQYGPGIFAKSRTLKACSEGQEVSEKARSAQCHQAPLRPSVGNTGKPIAPWGHTVMVLAPIAIGPIAGAYRHGLPNANPPIIGSRLSSYFTVLAIEGFAVLLIWLASRRSGFSIGAPVSGRWQIYAVSDALGLGGCAWAKCSADYARVDLVARRGRDCLLDGAA